MSPSVRYAVSILCLFATGQGCAHWEKHNDDPSATLPPRMSSDSVVLDIISVYLPPLGDEIDAALWAEIDEQHLPTDLRRQLADNGIRCGLIGSQLPQPLIGILQQQNNAQGDGIANFPMPDNSALRRRQLQSRSGYRNEIVVSSSSQPAAVLTRQDDQVRGKTYPQAEFKFALKTFPQGDGRVRVQLTPEIHYGEVQQRWIGQQGAFRLDAGRQRQVFAELRLVSMLSPGQTLLLSCTPQIKGLGRQFFRESGDDGTRQKLLLIRLSQTQYDDLFAPAKILSALATPSD